MNEREKFEAWWASAILPANYIDGVCKDRDFEVWQACAAEKDKELAEVKANNERELNYTKELAIAIRAKHYPEVITWMPLDSTLGLLSQIDNMTCGLKKVELETELATLQANEQATLKESTIATESIEAVVLSAQSETIKQLQREKAMLVALCEDTALHTKEIKTSVNMDKIIDATKESTDKWMAEHDAHLQKIINDQSIVIETQKSVIEFLKKGVDLNDPRR